MDMKNLVCSVIDEYKEKLHGLSTDLWNHPELAYEEIYAHKLLTSFLLAEGFREEKKSSLPTSFILCYGQENNELHVGLICEYDALPNIGHACGHNLISETGLAAALAVKSLIDANSDIRLKVSVFGTPAEERGGGKIQMLQDKVFDDVDFLMMSHPFAHEIPRPAYLAKSEFNVIFKGKASHAAAAPWEGINALDATIACYNAVGMLRQQIKVTSRVHCIILNGGAKPNIIPELSEMSFFVRGLTMGDMEELKVKVQQCAKGAALQTGCTLEIKETAPDYYHLKTNEELIKLYISNAKSLGIKFPEIDGKSGSTDMGNLSHYKPSIHPKYSINTSASNHSREFTAATGLVENQEIALLSAKSMAMTVVDVLSDKNILNDIKNEFLKA